MALVIGFAMLFGLLLNAEVSPKHNPNPAPQAKVQEHDHQSILD